MPTWPISGMEAERIDKLSRQLRRDDPLGSVAQAILTGGELPAGSTQILLDTVADRRARKPARGIAAWALGRIPLTEPEAQLAATRLSALLADRPAHSVGFLLATGCLCSYVLLIVGPILAYTDKPKNEIREMAALSLGRLGRRENVDDLIRAVTEMKSSTAIGDKQVRFASAYGLQLLLQQMPHGGLDLLDEEGVRSVYLLLRERPEARHLAVLNVLRAAGSSKAIPAVEKFAKKATAPDLKQAAQETLRVLNERKMLDAQRASLLRPAEENPADVDHLLRAARSGDADPSMLLRANGSTGESGDVLYQRTGEDEAEDQCG